MLLVASPDRLLCYRLVAEAQAFGQDAAHVSSVPDLKHALADRRPSLVLVDDRLADVNLCLLVQQVTIHGSGVLAMTSDDSELNVVLLLELGADDVVIRPFSMPELNARIRTILRRRSAPSATPPPPANGALTLHADSRMVTLRGKDIHIPRLEFAVLLALQSRDGRPVQRAVLFEECWPSDAVRSPAYVNAVIRRLRLRLEEQPSRPRHVIVVRGKGYALRT